MGSSADAIAGADGTNVPRCRPKLITNGPSANALTVHFLAGASLMVASSTPSPHADPGARFPSCQIGRIIVLRY